MVLIDESIAEPGCVEGKGGVKDEKSTVAMGQGGTVRW